MQEPQEMHTTESESIPPSMSLSQENEQLKSQAEHKLNIATEDHLSFLPNIIIPIEIAFHILQYLDDKSLVSASRVNKSWLIYSKNTIISWKQVFERYTQGFLWPYLFSKPDMDSYQSYFSEIWEVTDTYDNFPKGLQRIKEAYIVDVANYGRENAKNYGEKYLQKFDADQIKSESLATIKSLLQLTPDLRQGLLKQYNNEKCFNFSLKDCQLILPILIQIHKTDSLLTASIVIGKATQPYRPNLWREQWPYQKQAIVLDEDDIVALTIVNKDPFKKLLADPKLAFLLNKLTEISLLTILSIRPDLINFLIKHHEIFSRFSEDKLIQALEKLRFNLEEDFYYLVEKNPSFAVHMNSEFFIKLAQTEDSFVPLILTHPKLLELLSEDQFIQIISKILFLSGLNKILSSTAFWSWSCKIKNKSSFLLRFPHLEEVIKNDSAAALLEPEETLTKVIHCNVEAKALAAQYIILDKFNDDQFLRLAMDHPSISILMLQDVKLLHRWTESKVQRIREGWKHLKHHKEVEQINPCCERVLAKIRNKNKLDPISNETTQQPQPIARPTRATIHSQNALPSSESDNAINEMMVPASRSRLSFSKWQIAGIIALSLLGIAGVLLLATGVGSLLGVAFLTSVLTAVNIFNISISTAAIISTITGTAALVFTGTMSVKNKLRNFFCGIGKEQVKSSLFNIIISSSSSSYRNLIGQQLKRDSKLDDGMIESLTYSTFQYSRPNSRLSSRRSFDPAPDQFTENSLENSIVNSP